MKEIPMTMETGRTATSSFDPTAPIIIIGAGRSGSTLLVRTLNAHPDLSVKGETDFLLPRIWHAVWDNRFWYQWQSFTDTTPHAKTEYTSAVGDRNRSQEEIHASELTARFMAELVKADPARRFWGFKEIWNGSSAFHHDWEIYDRVFPRATWVHIVRHPLDYLGSAMSWNRGDRSLPKMQSQLDDWASMVQHSRKRAETGRFVEIRYEDLKQSPRQALEPLFKKLGVSWHLSCEEALGQKVLDSNRDAQSEEVVFRLLTTSRELVELARRYDYHLEETQGDPVETALRVEPATSPSADSAAIRATFGDRIRCTLVLAYLGLSLGVLVATRRVTFGLTWRKVARRVLWPVMPLIRKLRGSRPPASIPVVEPVEQPRLAA